MAQPAPVVAFHSSNERELSALIDTYAGQSTVDLPLSEHEDACPKCEKKADADDDWLAAAWSNGLYIRHDTLYGTCPRHCANKHWWIPVLPTERPSPKEARPKVYTEEEMKQLMLEKKKAGNPCDELEPGLSDSTATAEERKFVIQHEWRAVCLTREEYYDTEVYNEQLVKAALAQIESNRVEMAKTRKQSRELAAYAKKVSAQLKNNPKGTRGKKRHTR